MGTSKQRKELLVFMTQHLQQHQSNSTDTSKHLIVVASYGSYRRDQEKFAAAIPSWYYNVLDEGHLIKNTKTMTYQAVINIKSYRRIVLTGTPIQNDVSSIYVYCNLLLFFLIQEPTKI